MTGLTASVGLLLTFLILLNEFDLSTGGRGRGRYRSRTRGRGGYSSYRTSSSSNRVKVWDANGQMGPHAVNNSNWRRYFITGSVQGANRYLHSNRYRLHPDRKPTICTSTLNNTSTSGTNITMFICPKFNEPDEMDHCCGEENRQYCCSNDNRQTQLAENRDNVQDRS